MSILPPQTHISLLFAVPGPHEYVLYAASGFDRLCALATQLVQTPKVNGVIKTLYINMMP